MLTISSAEPAAVWFDASDRPARLVYRATRYRVIDTPTPLARQPEWPSGISHPPDDVLLAPGWRVTGRTDRRDVLVFDLRRAHWVGCRGDLRVVGTNRRTPIERTNVGMRFGSSGRNAVLPCLLQRRKSIALDAELTLRRRYR